jgi:hypothetical protein
MATRLPEGRKTGCLPAPPLALEEHLSQERHERMKRPAVTPADTKAW